jgi:hypothetical protein
MWRVRAYVASSRLRGEFAPMWQVRAYVANSRLCGELAPTYASVAPSSVGAYAPVGAYPSLKKTASDTLT